MKGITQFQLEILTKMVEIETATGRLADLDQLLSQLSWFPTKASLQFTIRALVKKGLIEKAPLESRRGRNRVCFLMLEEGRVVLDPRRLKPIKSEVEAEIFVPGLSEFEEIVEEGDVNEPKMS